MLTLYTIRQWHDFLTDLQDIVIKNEIDKKLNLPASLIVKYLKTSIDSLYNIRRNQEEIIKKLMINHNK